MIRNASIAFINFMVKILPTNISNIRCFRSEPPQKSESNMLLDSFEDSDNDTKRTSPKQQSSNNQQSFWSRYGFALKGAGIGAVIGTVAAYGSYLRDGFQHVRIKQVFPNMSEEEIAKTIKVIYNNMGLTPIGNFWDKLKIGAYGIYNKLTGAKWNLEIQTLPKVGIILAERMSRMSHKTK